ncbi:hypothetical protein ACGF0J_04840 [Nonomuraea sp. NPDC047897]|uniref:hypothetical protein n=1 Tax=Nonomuraea sp. NPDC047897 TaxID=3364346 RepID=UPI0037129982
MPHASRPVLLGSLLLAALLAGPAEVSRASTAAGEPALDVTVRPAPIAIPCTSIPFRRARVNCVADEARDRRLFRHFRAGEQRRERRDRQRRDRND